MFPLRENDDMLIQAPGILGQDLIEIDNILTGSTRKRQRKSRLGAVVEENKDEENVSVKKIMHRETERQRRQEMAALYASLRSLLPLEYIKGKRSVSDHMHEAVNYIKDMETNIKDLQRERDRLKNIMPTSDGSRGRNPNNQMNCVTVNCCSRDRIEILISCGIKEELGFPISKVLKELLRTGINIVSCISTKSNGRFLYGIQSDVCDLTNVDLYELKQRLANVIKLSG